MTVCTNNPEVGNLARNRRQSWSLNPFETLGLRLKIGELQDERIPLTAIDARPRLEAVDQVRPALARALEDSAATTAFCAR